MIADGVRAKLPLAAGLGFAGEHFASRNPCGERRSPQWHCAACRKAIYSTTLDACAAAATELCSKT